MKSRDNWPLWKRGEIIRNITNGRPFKVLQIATATDNNDTTTLVVPADLTDDMLQILAIQKKDYGRWVRDFEMDFDSTPQGVEYKVDKFK